MHGEARLARRPGPSRAPFGLAPKDFDLFLGLYTYLRELDELPADFLGRRCGFSVSSQKDYRRIRSRVFRFSYVKYTNSAFWNPELQSYDIRNFDFYSLASLSRATASRRPKPSRSASRAR